MKSDRQKAVWRRRQIGCLLLALMSATMFSVRPVRADETAVAILNLDEYHYGQCPAKYDNDVIATKDALNTDIYNSSRFLVPNETSKFQVCKLSADSTNKLRRATQNKACASQSNITEQIKRLKQDHRLQVQHLHKVIASKDVEIQKMSQEIRKLQAELKAEKTEKLQEKNVDDVEDNPSPYDRLPGWVKKRDSNICKVELPELFFGPRVREDILKDHSKGTAPKVEKQAANSTEKTGTALNTELFRCNMTFCCTDENDQVRCKTPWVNVPKKGTAVVLLFGWNIKSLMLFAVIIALILLQVLLLGSYVSLIVMKIRLSQSEQNMSLLESLTGGLENGELDENDSQTDVAGGEEEQDGLLEQDEEGSPNDDDLPNLEAGEAGDVDNEISDRRESEDEFIVISSSGQEEDEMTGDHLRPVENDECSDKECSDDEEQLF